MKLMRFMQSNPEMFMVFAIGIVGVCIIIMIIILLSRLQSERKITKAALELKRLTNSIHAGLVHFVLEDQCNILYASKGFYEMLGYKRDEVKKDNKLSLLNFIDIRDSYYFQEPWEQLIKDTVNLEIRVTTKSGETLYVLISGNVDVGKDGRHTVSVVMVDISEQKKMQEMILLEGERYRIATELSKDILFEYHIESDKMIYTDKYKDMFGNDPIIQDYLGNCDLRRVFIHPDDWGIYLELCQGLSQGKNIIEAEYRIKNKLGEFIWCQVKGKTIYDDDKIAIRVIGKMVNIDLQKRELEALEYKATRDPLTGVYNKEVSIKKIDKFLNGNKHNKHMLMFIDFDDFKQINDNYGHLRGDKVLTYVVDRIKNVFVDGEIIGRSGGDEFVVFCGNITNVNAVLKKADNLMNALNTTYDFNGQEIPISGSIGIAMYPDDGSHYEQLIECADKALYRVKEQGKNNYLLYEPHME